VLLTRLLMMMMMVVVHGQEGHIPLAGGTYKVWKLRPSA